MTSGIKGTFHDFGRQEKTDKIDYIIARDSFQLVSAVTWEDSKEGVYLSDHYPVCVELI